METFASDGNGNGVAVMLTNEPALWLPPKTQTTRDIAFHIYDRRLLTGHLAWGPEDNPRYGVDLVGRYDLKWETYSPQSDGPELRYLVIEARS